MCDSVPAAHACHEAVECIPVVQKLVTHAQECQLLKAATRRTGTDGTLIHAVKRILVIPACRLLQSDPVDICKYETPAFTSLRTGTADAVTGTEIRGSLRSDIQQTRGHALMRGTPFSPAK